MVKKGSKIYSILKSKCPHCHEGDFFEGSFFKAQVKERCDVCNERFSKEPGFYQGSYYVVYALGVAIFVTIWVSINLFFSSISFDATLIAIVAGLILSSPFTYPLSKTIWANFFFHYQQNEKEKITKIDT
ncbi:MAG: hypothetical protein ACJASQ_000030 [Crocinitomicaceae bacterium]|jgi:uncharacterized protein (DUF983 family)